jgi:hypothetical protein
MPAQFRSGGGGGDGVVCHIFTVAQYFDRATDIFNSFYFSLVRDGVTTIPSL